MNFDIHPTEGRSGCRFWIIAFFSLHILHLFLWDIELIWQERIILMLSCFVSVVIRMCFVLVKTNNISLNVEEYLCTDIENSRIPYN